MKLVGKLFSYVGLVLASIIGLVFAFIELRSLFAGDFTLMNNVATAFINTLCRGLYYLSLMVVSVYTFVTLIRKKETNAYILTVASVVLICSGFTFVFYEYYVALAVMAAGIIVFAVNFAYLPKKVKEEPTI